MLILLKPLLLVVVVGRGVEIMRYDRTNYVRKKETENINTHIKSHNGILGMQMPQFLAAADKPELVIAMR